MRAICESHIYARVQNSNCHHIKIKGQWMIKDGLKKVAESMKMTLEQIINFDTPEEVEQAIQIYELAELRAKVEEKAESLKKFKAKYKGG